jgi:hypothetical protein
LPVENIVFSSFAMIASWFFRLLLRVFPLNYFDIHIIPPPALMAHLSLNHQETHHFVTFLCGNLEKSFGLGKMNSITQKVTYLEEISLTYSINWLHLLFITHSRYFSIDLLIGMNLAIEGYYLFGFRERHTQ